MVAREHLRLLGLDSAPAYRLYLSPSWLWDHYGTVGGRLIGTAVPQRRDPKQPPVQPVKVDGRLVNPAALERYPALSPDDLAKMAYARRPSRQRRPAPQATTTCPRSAGPHCTTDWRGGGAGNPLQCAGLRSSAAANKPQGCPRQQGRTVAAHQAMTYPRRHACLCNSLQHITTMKNVPMVPMSHILGQDQGRLPARALVGAHLAPLVVRSVPQTVMFRLLAKGGDLRGHASSTYPRRHGHLHASSRWLAAALMLATAYGWACSPSGDADPPDELVGIWDALVSESLYSVEFKPDCSFMIATKGNRVTLLSEGGWSFLQDEEAPFATLLMNLMPHIVRVSDDRMCFLTGISLNLDEGACIVTWERVTALAEGVAVSDGNRVGRVAFMLNRDVLVTPVSVEWDEGDPASSLHRIDELEVVPE